MDNNYYSEAMKALEEMISLREMKEQRLSELEAYKEYSLKYARHGNSNYYYAKRKGDKKYFYLGGENNEDVRRIKESVYLRKLLKNLGIEIKLLTALQISHKDISYDAILSQLPLTYKTNVPHEASGMQAARAWKEAKLKEKAQYPVKYPEQLKMHDIEGTPMRSKSEVIIANILIANGIPFVYELPRVINGQLIYPDFTILSTIDYKTEIIIEHEGLTDQEFYQKTFLYKVNLYLGAGIVPGRGVYFTFDDLRGGFDPAVVQDIVDSRLRPKRLST